MNKKKVFGIIGIVIIVIYILLVVIDSNWLTHPRYMIDSTYCQEDSDCDQLATCYAVNKYVWDSGAFECLSGGKGSECTNNICKIIPFNPEDYGIERYQE